MAADLPQILQVGIYILSLYIFGRIFDKFYAKLIGEILVGMILGPNLLNFIPFTDCLTLFGEIGLIYIVTEGGLGINQEQLKKIGARAFIIAITGTIVPLFLGWLFMLAMGTSALEGLAAGTVLSSTAIGVTLTLLTQQNQIGTETGKLIVVAAMIDDVASLVILAMLNAIKQQDSDEDKNQVWAILGPLVISLAYLILSYFLSKYVLPKLYRIFEDRFKGDQYDKLRERVSFVSVIVLAGSLSYAVQVSGSTHLLGAFIAGMSFSQIKHVEKMFGDNKQPKEWLARLFFGSLGFSIPVSIMFTWNSFLYGLLYTIPAVLGKLIVGVFAKDRKLDFWVIGWAMVGNFFLIFF